MVLAGHQEGGLDVRAHAVVHAGHLELEVEIGDRAQAADDHPGAEVAGEIDQQAGEGADLDGGAGAGGDSGAFTFLPSRATSGSLRHRGLLKTINDADVFREVSPEQLVVASGPPGSGCMVDTSRCLHQGSRARERPRLVFQFQYVSRPDALIARDLVKPKPGGNFVVTRRSIAGMTPANPDWEAYVDE